MAGTWTSERFPQFEPAIRRLAERHRELEDEPLHLALSYGPDRDQQDVFLLEIVGSNGGESVNPDRELFETTFNAAPGFPMELPGRLHLILTSPGEFDVALHEDWPSTREIVSAVRRGDYKTLYVDAEGRRILDQLKSETQWTEGAARG